MDVIASLDATKFHRSNSICVRMCLHVRSFLMLLFFFFLHKLCARLNHIHIVYFLCVETKTEAKCKIALKSVCILEHDDSIYVWYASSETVQYLNGSKVF